MRNTLRARYRIAWLLALLHLLATGLSPAPARAAPDTRKRAPQLEVEILSPEDGATLTEPLATLQVVVRARPGTTVRLHPLVNGQRLEETTRGLVVRSEQPGEAPPLQREQLHTVKVPLPDAPCTVAVVAETDAATRTSNTVRLGWRSPGSFVVKPKLYILSVGVSGYRDGALTLGYASKDADDFAKAFLAQQGGLYEQVHAQILLNGQATRDRILDGLQWLQRQTTAKDVAILFLAGHGIDDPSNGVYYFLPHDAVESAQMRTMISQQSLQTALRSIPGKTLLFLDTCHAASVMNGAAGRAVSDITRLVQELAQAENGLVVYAAASGRQLSQESPRWGNGAFTKAVIEGLQGHAAYHAGRPITIQMLNLYISERVKELTAGAQTPIMVTSNKLADFPLALLAQRPATPPPLPPPPPPQSPPPLAFYQPPPLSRPQPPPPSLPPPENYARQRLLQPDLSRSPVDDPLVPTSDAAPPAPAVPAYRKPWFWLAIGGAVALAGGLVAYGVVSARDASNQMGTMSSGPVTTLTFTKVE